MLVDGERLRIVAHEGPYRTVVPAGATLPLSRGSVFGAAILDRRVVHVPDAAAAAFRGRFPEAHAMARASRAPLDVAILVAPLVLDGRAVGAVNVRRRRRPFTAAEIALLRAFADHAAVALESARRGEDLAEALAQQAAEAEILRAISRSPGALQAILDSIVQSAARLCDSRDALIMRVTDAGIVPVATHGRIGAALLERGRAMYPSEPGRMPTFPFDRGWVGGRAALERRTVHVPDLAAEADAEYPVGKPAAVSIGHRTILSTPLMREGQVIGVIGVYRAEVRPFSGRQITLLESFADQAIIAIENARLFTELEARNRELTSALAQQRATSDILRAISRSQTDVQPVFDEIVASVVRLLRGQHSAMTRVVGDQLELAAVTPMDPTADAFFRSFFPQPLAGNPGNHARAIREGVVVNIADTETDPRVPERTRTAARLGAYRSWVTVPMAQRDVRIGTIAVTRREPGGFRDEEIALVQTFADQAVIAVENVRLFREVERRNRELSTALDRQTATSDILRAISRAQTDAQPVFDGIVQSAERLLHGYTAAVTLVVDGRIELVAYTRTEPSVDAFFRSLFPQDVAGSPTVHAHAIRERGVVNIADTDTDERLNERSRAYARTRGYRSWVTVPMVHRDAAIGTVAVTRREPGGFGDDEVALLRMFAEQAVIAIENVRLFRELGVRNRDLTAALERQTATSEILRVIAGSPTEIRPVLAAVAGSAARLCEAYDAIVLLRDGEWLLPAAHHGPIPMGSPVRGLPIGRSWVAGRAFLERQPVHVHDLASAAEEFPDGHAMALRAGHRTTLAVPLLREDEAVGAILIRRVEVRPFSGEQIDVLKTFADQAVIAIENVRLFQALETRNAELTETLAQLTAASEVLRAISASPTDVQPVFDAIARNAVTLCGGVMSAVFRFDGQLMHVGALHGFSPEGAEGTLREYPRRPERGMIAGRAVLDGAVVQVPDVDADPEFTYRPVAQAAGWRSLLVVPILRGGAVLGTVGVARQQPGPFREREVELLKTFAEQAVIAIENVRLFHELQTRNRALGEALERQTATAEILRAISQAQTDTRPVFEAIAESAMRLFGAHGVLVWRHVDGLVQLVAARGGRPGSSEIALDRWRTPQPPDSDSFMTQVLRTRTMQQILDAETDPSITPVMRERARDRGWRSTVLVPMLRGEEALGVIGVSRVEPGGLTPEQLVLLQTFADQAVIAVENARLLAELQARTAELQRSVRQLTALGEVGRAVSSSLDLETVLTTIVSRAVQLTGVDGGVVFEYDEATEEFVHRAATETGAALAEARRLTRVRKGEGVLGRTAITLEPVQVTDIAVPGAYESRMRDNLMASGIRALLAVPMLRESRLVGSLVVSRNQPGEFPPETVDLLRTFATQSAVAIQNARLYRELAEQGRRLEVASRHKSEFLASMSHELRTPLNAILGFNEMILGDVYGPVPADLLEPLADIQASGRHLLRLINNVLDLSKIEAGRMELALGDYAVPDVVERVRTSLHSLAADKGLEFVTAVADDLPLARGDAGRITQCLTNLAGNALKFTRQGRVEVAAELRGELLVYRVSDTGIGIAPEKMATLFTEFRQGDATIASEFGGTGLGLSITRKFAEMHRGRVWAESEPGKGSTFFLALPLRLDGGATA